MQVCQRASYAAHTASSSKGLLSELMPLHGFGTLRACMPGLQRLLPAGPARQMIAGRCPGCRHGRSMAHNAGTCPCSLACGISCCACLDTCARSTPSCCSGSVGHARSTPCCCACSHACAGCCAASQCARTATRARCTHSCGWRCLPCWWAACSCAMRLHNLPAGSNCS